jgi:hypothetical protein
MHDGADRGHTLAASAPRSSSGGPEVIELFVVAGLAFTVLIVIGVLISVFSVAGWFLWLPFKIIGWALRLVGLLIAAPFIILGCMLGGFGFLLGTGFMLLPLFPLLAVGGILYWLFHKRGPAQPHARVV